MIEGRIFKHGNGKNSIEFVGWWAIASNVA